MNEKNDTRTRLLTESPLKLMFSLSIPGIIGMVVVALYNMMDAIFVGQLVSSTAMGAVSVSYPLTLINGGVSTLVGVGSASILSRAIGKKDKAILNKIMGNLVMMITILSIIITIIGMCFTRQLLQFSRVEGEMLTQAESYLKIIFAGSLFINFTQSSNMVMRGQGLLKKAMVIIASGSILNIILDPIFITYFNQYGMGIQGAAYATLVSQIVQFCISMLYFTRKSEGIKIKRLKLEWDIIPEICSVGISAMLMQVMTLVQQTVIFNIGSRYGGESAYILLGAALRVQNFAFVPLWGMSQGFQPVVGTNYGAKNYSRTIKLTKVFVLSAIVLSLCFFLPIQIIPEKILSLFITENDIVTQGVSNFRLMFSTYSALAVFIMIVTLFQSLGTASKASMLVMLRQIILFIPAVILFPMIANLGETGVWLAIALVDCFVGVLCLFMMFKEFRKLKKLA
ncbi:MATE efflux family protein [Clostridioides difficile CD160]|nr:MATE efflux family protein [Clostridioides difficile CD160]